MMKQQNVVGGYKSETGFRRRARSPRIREIRMLVIREAQTAYRHLVLELSLITTGTVQDKRKWDC